MHAQSFNKNGQNNAANNANANNNGQANGASAAAPAVSQPAPVIAQPQQQPEPVQNNSVFSGLDDNYMSGMSMEFTNPTMGGSDVLTDFDFDSFLHNDVESAETFAFDSTFLEDGVIAE